MKEFPLCVIWNDMLGMTKDTRALPFRSFKELYDCVEGKNEAPFDELRNVLPCIKQFVGQESKRGSVSVFYV